jgi:hypothetical protein
VRVVAASRSICSNSSYVDTARCAGIESGFRSATTLASSEAIDPNMNSFYEGGTTASGSGSMSAISATSSGQPVPAAADFILVRTQ